MTTLSAILEKMKKQDAERIAALDAYPDITTRPVVEIAETGNIPANVITLPATSQRLQWSLRRVSNQRANTLI